MNTYVLFIFGMFDDHEDIEYFCTDVIGESKVIKSIIFIIIDNECNLKKTNKLNNKWRKDYMKQGYKFMSRENIFKNVSKILQN
jgi:hypothetical protein